MNTITVSLSDETADEAFQAEYFLIEGGWVTLKTEDHKAIAAYPEKRVTRIKSEPAGPSDDWVAESAEVGGRRHLVKAFDYGFTACANEHTKQRKDPSYPINRVNPYEARK